MCNWVIILLRDEASSKIEAVSAKLGFQHDVCLNWFPNLHTIILI